MPNPLVVVTGAPGAGKSTLATALASQLELPLVMKDTIKEAMHDGFGGGEITLEESRRLGAATYEVMWAIAAHLPAAILECNFRPDDERVRSQLLRLNDRPVEVFCRCPADVAAARYAERHQRGERHAAHVLAELPVDALRVFDTPLALGPVVEVDTTAGVDVEHVARLVLAALT